MKKRSIILLLSCFILAAVTNASFNDEANRLRALIKSQISSPQALRSDKLLPSNAEDHTPYSNVYTGPQDGLQKSDKIDALPGQPKDFKLEQYGGYVTVDPKHGRALFYYFVEAPHGPSKKPLVLWLNGGPGCSSLGGGAMLELGPFIVNRDGKTLDKNQYSWINEANIIFLESPAGVGFSYSNTTDDYDGSGDDQTAEDNYTFLINWLERFPAYKNRAFYLTGESYAGHYVPQLASYIIAENAKKNSTVINLKGIVIGNPYIDATANLRGRYEYCWGHGLLTDEIHDEIQSKCNFDRNLTADCQSLLGMVDDQTGDLDIYNIYAPLCNQFTHANVLSFTDPCATEYIASYLNLKEVQEALHANTTGLNYPWSECSRFIGLGTRWVVSPDAMVSVIKQLISTGIRVWIYSGDFDSVVPFTATKHSLLDLKLSVESSLRPWFINGQVGGFVTEYKGLTFSTVRGAGHLVPHDQPERALFLFSSFLKGKFDTS